MKNKTVLITGAAGGIGHAFAEVIAEDSCNLVLIDIRAKELRETKQAIENAFPIKIKTICKDLTKDTAAQEIFDELKSENISIDILINNVGMGDFGFFAECDWNKQATIIHLNILATLHLTRLFLPLMIAKGKGKILNVASVSAFAPSPLMSVYFASKAFLVSFSQAIGEEVRSKGVSVTTLCPGPVKTAFQTTVNDAQPEMANKKFSVSDVKAVAMYGYKVLKKERKLAIYGFFAKISVFMMSNLPKQWVCRIMFYLQKQNRKSLFQEKNAE